MRLTWPIIVKYKKKYIYIYINLVGHTVFGGPTMMYPSLVGSGTLWSTRAHEARVWSRIIEEPMKLFKFSPASYSRFMGSGTSQSTRAHEARVWSWGNKFEELDGLFNYPASYSSFMGSGTSQSTRAHQARVQHSGPPSPVWPTKLIYIYFFSFYILR